jgi:UDP-N-acetylglucosamine:LPS N-acetylglucosamine transferase
MTKLLILSSDTGEGHNSAAAAIENAVRSAGFQAKIRKPIEESNKINRSLANLYNVLLTYRPQWMGCYLGLIDRLRPNEREFFYSKVRRYIGQFLDAERPDVVLSVHPMLNHFIPKFIKEEGLGIPCFTFVTDPFPPFWRGWTSPYIDRYFVPTDEALQALTASGIPAWRIERVSMPVRPRFEQAAMSEIQALRDMLELDDQSMILVNGGARGGGPILQIYKSIRKAAPDSNVLVVCGKNGRIRSRIDSLRDSRTRTFGFVEDIHRYVAASDIVVTKPGALSTYEALACRVPVLLTSLRCLMPQESGLFDAAHHYDFGFGARTFADLERIIQQGPAAWYRKRESITQFYTPSSTGEWIERIQPIHA